MREILFRGKRIDNGEWVEGYYAKLTVCVDNSSEERDFIIPHDIPVSYSERASCCFVIPETISEFTGICDKNGKRIFEGDIVKGTFYGYPMPFENYVFTIGWQEDVAGYKANYFENVEVIGNIHDNSELIGGKDDE